MLRTVACAFLALLGTLAPLGASLGNARAAFIGTEILGRPTDHSITINALADEELDVYFEYGTVSGSYTDATTSTPFSANDPIEVVLDSLAPDTRYYYRMRYRVPGNPTFSAGAERTFHTQRPPGSAFTFTIQADPHLDAGTSTELYQCALLNALADSPDFHVDLGDTFMSEKFAITYAATVQQHLKQLPYLGLLCHSAPLFLILGNHEGELGWLLDGTADTIPVWATTARKLYFANPTPDGFYTGDTAEEPFVGRRESYYAWTWGDALFVVLDPFWNTTTKPNQSDNWEWTLGDAQYAWLAQTLAQSPARFKFVLSHHMTGGVSTEGRGGTAAAGSYEWGGRNADGSWGFDTERPGWALPIHQLMVANGVTAFFHGHDHLFAYEDLDGVVYQEVPQPSHPNFNNTGHAAEWGYGDADVVSNSGHLRVRVSESSVAVDYVRAYRPADEDPTRVNGSVDYTYAIPYVAPADVTRCRRSIVKEAARLVQLRSRALALCERKRLKGDPATDCATDTTTATRIAKAEAKLRERIDRTCGGDDRLCGNVRTGEVERLTTRWPMRCPSFGGSTSPFCTGRLNDCADIATCIACIEGEAVDTALGLDLAPLVPSEAGTPVNTCQQAIVKETQRFLQAKSTALRTCWDGRIKGKHGDACPDATATARTPSAKAAEKIASAESRLVVGVCGACGGAGKACATQVGAVPGDGQADDLDPGSIFAGSFSCPSVRVPEGEDCGAIGAVDTLSKLVDCLRCVTVLKTDCMDRLAVPGLAEYPVECNP